MAIDTAEKRYSMLNFGAGPTLHLLFEADSAVDADDRQHLLDCYAGIAFSAADVLGTAVQTLPALTQSAAGTATTAITGTATQTLPAMTQSAAGTAGAGSSITGTATQTLPSLTQTAAGTGEIPVVTPILTQGTQRNLIFGMDPVHGLTGTFSWQDVLDLNSDEKGITIGYVPRTKGKNISILQETLFLGTINAGLVMQTFRGDLTRDGSNAFTAKAITNRIDPDLINRPQSVENPALKVFWDIEFMEVNPVTHGATIQYTRDSKRPHVDAVSWEDFVSVSGAARFAFNNNKARWTHIKIEDATVLANKPVFGGFLMRYAGRNSRERGPTNAST